MNFLAHLYLSGDNQKLLIGNFIGDFVKGKNALESYEREIVYGIELHRSIDEFTDKHPTVSRSKNKLREKYRHYSGVIIDVFYDHFLANNWKEYHNEPLSAYAASTYQIIEAHYHILPADVKSMFPYMKRGNWLLGYSFVDGIHRALTGMASRTTFVSKMEEASHDLIKHYDEFESEFREFFPELIDHCAQKINSFR